jgi:hypothetical protein
VKRLVALAFLVVLLVAACGGGGGRLSHGEFVNRADALCRQSVAELKKLQNPVSIPQLVTYLKKARPIQRHFLDEARKLKPPVKDEPDWKRALALDDKVLGYYDEMSAAAKRGDQNNLRRVGAALRALPAKNPYEQRLGMTGC